MPRKRPKVDGSFVLLGEEQREGFKLFLGLPGMRDIFEELARDGHQSDRRGLIVWVSRDGTVGTLAPPVYIAAGSWRRNPLLVNTPHPELLQALITYDPKAAYIVLVAGPAGPTLGQYTWWIEDFAKKRGQRNPLLS
jgi:hypothetical protein